MSVPVWAVTAKANQIEAKVHRVTTDGIGEPIGTIQIRSNEHGVLFEPDLSGLEPGRHGFHLHENGSCELAEKKGEKIPAGAAGGHYNPGSGEHRGPFEEGHKGDLPALYVNDDGKATVPVLAPALKFADLLDRSLVIHSGGDNYDNSPDPLGGGGDRVACVVVTGE
ncbi:superoxide dismutase [Cu-Zn] SodC [Marinobacter sp. 1_MG-2023]|uniref:superoxide dismutase [Cu-Zn] SodC n=1 Tax=Marinobacter sp. 1_MG-2023 TaxID=3062627 RepID=UPI0026E46F40|nr:superoxide dismutase [Cu-Zn] SodC [Marinobacter sp. 1_MG-2023]MDO6824850.1 superoxide dismutase [Cu-Zn] SodC [Marinobacter sp. 1_MG-2023]